MIYACTLMQSINFPEEITNMKSYFFIYIPILAVIVICIYIFAVCKAKKNPEKKYAAPLGFDSKNNGAVYGILTEKSYFSATTNTTRKCYVYTPPGFDSNLTYPVVYLLHGIGGTHAEWLGGNPNEILSNLINAGNAKPMIVVMPNVRAMNPDSVPSDIFGEVNIKAFNNFINDLKNDLMPFITNNYPVSNERNKRAIAGLSMGGMESIYIGISMPEIFGCIGAFSAAPGLPLTPKQMILQDEYKNNTFILICCGLEDSLLSFSQNYNQSFVNNGIKTTYYEIHGGHDFDVWKNGLYHFSRKIFK